MSEGALHSTIFQHTSGKATEYDSKSGEYLVEVEDGTSIWVKPTELSKANDGLAAFGDESSEEDDDEAGGGGKDLCEDELASQAESETEEPPLIKDETEEQAARRIKNERAGKVTYSQAQRLKVKDGPYRKKVIDAAKLGHLPAQVRRATTHVLPYALPHTPLLCAIFIHPRSLHGKCAKTTSLN